MEPTESLLKGRVVHAVRIRAAVRTSDSPIVQTMRP
jgi:hypothetical protein